MFGKVFHGSRAEVAREFEEWAKIEVFAEQVPNIQSMHSCVNDMGYALLTVVYK